MTSKDDQSNLAIGMDPGQFIRQALTAGLPVETLERLLELRADLKREKDKEAFFSALSRFQKEIPSIEKKSKVNTGSYIYSYADMATIQEAVYPSLAENDLSVTFECELTGDIMIVSCLVHHKSGHFEKTEFKIPVDSGMRVNHIQKVGAAFTYGRRYALLGALGIATAEEDTDASDPTSIQRKYKLSGFDHKEDSNADDLNSASPFISEAQHTRLETLISESKVPRERIRSWIENRHGIHYPDGVHFNKLYLGHATEVERFIPKFQQKIKKEWELAQSDEKANKEAQKDFKEKEAIDWVRENCLWSGNLDNLREIVIDLEGRAQSSKEAAQRKDGIIDDEEMRVAIKTGEIVTILKGYIKDQEETYEASTRRIQA